ncbi:hypothetical protein AVT69_gp046 [Pseudomonas phage PhiPA3]|uniref:Uncharacterized protein 045 n=1 Tax=Pseudomonas phage PhiPA3 TaxID=998086 RepID=F8SJS7_BPPA3|nr:hypothetical protein AVT69_gp046 [Pseudomonas phage PhiPA3]AEH03472.1 hypothetical protein [Pseudomonas phage PhiPA3]
MDNKTHYELVVLGSISGAQLAEWFRLKFYQDHLAEEHDATELEDLMGMMRRRKKHTIGEIRKNILHFFQRTVMTNFGETILETAANLEDLLDDDDHSVVMTYKTYKEFKLNNPFLDVVAMFPLDMNGTFGFVVCRNNMTADSFRTLTHGN